MFRNLRNSFRGNHIHIKKENFILDKILCCTLHHVILENTWLLERMYHISSVSLEWMYLSPCLLSLKATYHTWLSENFFLYVTLNAFLSIPFPNDFFKQAGRSMWRLLSVIFMHVSHTVLSHIGWAAHCCCCHRSQIALSTSEMSLALKIHSGHSVQVIHNMQNSWSSTVTF